MQDVAYTQEQREAIALCADTSVTIASVTGAAGTGKTTILKAAHDQLFDQFCERYDIAAKDYNHDEWRTMPFSMRLAAPTGRAAERIKEATGIEAMTVHRMLRFSVPEDDDDSGLPAHSKNNPMPYHAIFVDEASMIDVDLRRFIIDAMRRGCIIRFFGDINQLPPIPKANQPTVSPFAKDLKKFPSVTLTENFRSTDGIISVSANIIKNRMPRSNDQVAINRVKMQDATNFVMSLAKITDFTSLNNQIICPTNETKFGCTPYNNLIQQRFNPEKEKITIWHTDIEGKPFPKNFKRGDKILWTKNDYNVGLMNGTIGTLLSFDKDTGVMFVNMDGRDIEIPPIIYGFNNTTGERFAYDPRKQITLGYAISTHKSQGSQFDHVVFVVSRTRAAVRQNIYTGVTRAKFSLNIVDIAGSLSYALNNPVKILED